MENEDKLSVKIMVIDSDVVMMEILSEVLGKYGHKVYPFTEPVAAIEALKTDSFDILIVNYLMSPVNGDRIIEIVREFNKDIYVILMSNRKDLVPTMNTMRNLDIQAYFEKSSRFDQLIILIQSGIKHTEQLKSIEKMNLRIEKNIIDFANILLKTVAAKDHQTGDHSQRVAKYCILFAEYLGLSKEDTESLRLGALFHDIGKIGIPDNILLKQGKLTEEEFDTMKLHTVIGANIMGLAEFCKNTVPVILSHHEKWDGSGYPNSLKGEEIPLLARIQSIFDSFDAIISARPYKEPTSIEVGVEKVIDASGKSFDPVLVKKFEQFIKENKEKILEIKAHD